MGVQVALVRPLRLISATVTRQMQSGVDARSACPDAAGALPAWMVVCGFCMSVACRALDSVVPGRWNRCSHMCRCSALIGALVLHGSLCCRRWHRAPMARARSSGTPSPMASPGFRMCGLALVEHLVHTLVSSCSIRCSGLGNVWLLPSEQISNAVDWNPINSLPGCPVVRSSIRCLQVSGQATTNTALAGFNAESIKYLGSDAMWFESSFQRCFAVDLGGVASCCWPMMSSNVRQGEASSNALHHRFVSLQTS